ncbi:specifically androgen-regulated gene protein [Danio aesculapii]|uniref:specifically androgen-regulated gene protein n=1 Tax=Danio aesculapii TaxID=1142201 RepID=UPI0024BFE9BD|nr:specifically androgen-regulated gene protein [Danio aesculapii]XP_056312245.1 specifically androgen-regulated gene protein [Danio aesculapii]
MDVHMHNSRTLHYGLNDCAEDDLQFLSLEERECIQFFQETIDSLEAQEQPEQRGRGNGRGSGAEWQVEKQETRASTQHSPADQDIIDLVHPTDHTHRPTNTLTDFRELVSPPETHVKARRDSNTSDNQRRSSLELPQSHKHGPPTHAKPTRLPESISLLLGSRENIPHSIAAEAVSVQERRALMLANLSGSAHPLDGGEPACVRNLPMRSVSFCDPTPDKSRMEALSKLGLAQRRTQSAVHTLPKEETNAKPATMSTETRFNPKSDTHSSPRDAETKAKPATRSDSIDNTSRFNLKPDMHSSPIAEIKAKRSDSIENSFRFNPRSEIHSSPVEEIRAKPATRSDSIENSTRYNPKNEIHSSPVDETKAKPATRSNSIENSTRYNPKSDIHSSPVEEIKAKPATRSNSIENPHRYNPKSIIHSSQSEETKAKPPIRRNSTENTTLRSDTDTTDHPKSTPMLTSAEVTHSGFNSFGGKSITLNPMTSFRNESPSIPVAKTEAPEVHLNSFGGRSRVVSLSEHTRPKTFNSTTDDRSSNPEPSWKKQAPTPAPRPQKAQPTSGPRPPASPEHRRKSLPKQSFRTQGITVQFSGRGATDEARRDALRKLGLLRDTS